MNEDVKQTHTVFTDALTTLGTIIDATAERDAIHLAVEPVIAGETLYPGQHIRYDRGKAFGVQPGAGIGIVDPFLAGAVHPGQRFWFVVYPRKISSLRHVWELPSVFPETQALTWDVATAEETVPVVVPVVSLEPAAPTSAVSDSINWVGNFADRVGLEYDEVMDGANDYIAGGGYVSREFLEGQSVPDEFWTHYETITGRRVSEVDRGSFFTCSC